jgi:predicted amidophosphoribosyltransferase
VFGPLVEALFPMRCAGCGRGAWPFCPECVSGIVVLSPPWCRRCGAPQASSPTTCRDCPPAAVAISRAPFGFVGPVRRAVHRLKFGGWRPVADALAIAMVGSWDGAPWGHPDAVTWVPLSRHRLASRGYDQAKALSTAVALRLGVPRVRLLRRTGDAGPQARRGGAERRQAMRGVFAAAGQASGRILLVDDVMTTGATAGACAEALRAAGASGVAVLTAARSIASIRAPGASAYTRGGLASGSVVAPGNSSPAVDASRGRSDPRKPTLGR